MSSRPKTWENIVASSAIAVSSFIGFSVYVLLLIVQLKYSSKYKNSYYSLWMSLAVSDCTMLALALFYSVPCTYLQAPFLGENFDVAMGVCSNTAYFAGLACVSIIAINRYWGVCRFYSYRTIFDRSKAVLIKIVKFLKLLRYQFCLWDQTNANGSFWY